VDLYIQNETRESSDSHRFLQGRVRIADTISRPCLLGLCIFSSRLNRDVAGVVTRRFLAEGGSVHILILSLIKDFTFCWKTYSESVLSFSWNLESESCLWASGMLRAHA